MKIVLGCDHAGYELKQQLMAELAAYQIEDAGCCNGQDSVDYPDYAFKVAKQVASGQFERGILICGTGIGMSITANKVAGIRAALCKDVCTAEMARKHNDANILVMGGRVTEVSMARKILNAFLTTDFEGGRHSRRLAKIHWIENSLPYCSE
jgi:ribose 5-phosphate isomerase B